MTGIILSGGKNTRMGVNKAFIRINGERIIDRTIRIFRELFEEIVLVTNDPLAYLEFDLKIVTDIIKGKAALGGIYTGLFHASCDRAFVCSCDMPFLNVECIRYLQDRAKGYDVVVPVQPEGFQPLHAIYSRRCLPAIKRCIDADRLKITGFYKKARVLEVPFEAIAPFDPEGRMFCNVNSPDDLENAHNGNGH